MRAWRRISSASSANDLERDRVVGDPLEQPLANSCVVGQARLPHQRRVGREARDPRVGGEREDPVEIGAVGEDLESRSSSMLNPTHSSRSRRPGRGLHPEVGPPVVASPVRRCGFSTRIVRHPAPRPPPRRRPCPRSSTSREIDVEVGRSAEQHSRPRLPAVAVLPEVRIDRVRVMQAVAVVVDDDALVGEESNHVLVGRTQIVARGLALGRAWLVRDNDDT